MVQCCNDRLPFCLATTFPPDVPVVFLKAAFLGDFFSLELKLKI